MVAAALSLLSLVLAVPIVLTFWETGLVPRLPTAVLCASLALAALGSFLSGLILDSVNRGRHEIKRMEYLRHTLPLSEDLPGASRAALLSDVSRWYPIVIPAPPNRHSRERVRNPGVLTGLVGPVS